MSITSNTGPLIALAKVKQLHLLEQLYWLSDELIAIAAKLAGEN